MLRMIMGKFNAFLFLAFHDDLGPYLRRELDFYLEGFAVDEEEDIVDNESLIGIVTRSSCTLEPTILIISHQFN